MAKVGRVSLWVKFQATVLRATRVELGGGAIGQSGGTNSIDYFTLVEPVLESSGRASPEEEPMPDTNSPLLPESLEYGMRRPSPPLGTLLSKASPEKAELLSLARCRRWVTEARDFSRIALVFASLSLFIFSVHNN